jgi:hypothetical protein
VDLYPQLRLAGMAECVNTSKESKAQNSHLRAIAVVLRRTLILPQTTPAT